VPQLRPFSIYMASFHYRRELEPQILTGNLESSELLQYWCSIFAYILDSDTFLLQLMLISSFILSLFVTKVWGEINQTLELRTLHVSVGWTLSNMSECVTQEGQTTDLRIQLHRAT
jgi:hypothetical protein